MAFKQVEQPIEHVHAVLATVGRDAECRIPVAQNSPTDRLRRETAVALREFPRSFQNLIVQNKRRSMGHAIWPRFQSTDLVLIRFSISRAQIAGPVTWTDSPCASTETVTGMSRISNS